MGVYLFDSDSFALETQLEFKNLDELFLSNTNFSVISFQQSRPEPKEIIIECLRRTEILLFIEKVASLKSNLKKPEVKKLANLQICPKIGQILNKEQIHKNENTMWKKAKYKEKIEYFSKGFFFDAWEPGYILIYRDFLILYETKLTNDKPILIPLYE